MPLCVGARGALYLCCTLFASGSVETMCPFLFVNYSLFILVRMFNFKGESQAQESLDIF